MIMEDDGAAAAAAAVEELNCPEYSPDDFVFLDTFSYWVEGVLQVSKNS